jgi:hypothetical protein
MKSKKGITRIAFLLLEALNVTMDEAMKVDPVFFYVNVRL